MQKVEDLIQKWMPPNNDLLPFYEGISDFVKEYICVPIDEELKPLKIIADPLIGYIHLNSMEVAIIDTPLFQRLRNISQLGLAYMVYPSLNYSRFEHSLGVLGYLNKLIIQIIDNYNKKNDNVRLESIIEKNEHSLRLAALLHDIGHCLFSHCSERFLSNLTGVNITPSISYPSATSIIEIFKNHFNKEIPLAEILTISIIGTKEFADFIINLEILKKKETYENLENCCRFILGLPVKGKPETLFLAQLISSGFDVDKVDYMLREQHYTGVKLEIDLDRIMGKLNVFDLQSHELPEQLQYLKREFDEKSQFKTLGFSKDGQFVFEEFCIARLALNVKIYLHQKVRAAEGQLAKILKDLSENETNNRQKELQKLHNWLKVPEAILQCPEILNLLFNNHEKDYLFPQVSFVKEEQIKILKNIENRKLYRRAFAFGFINSLSESVMDNEIIDNKDSDFFSSYDENRMRIRILETIKEIFPLVGKELNENELDNFIVDNPRLRLKNIQQGHKTLFFERSRFTPFKWTIPLDKIGMYFEESRAFGYIFAEEEMAPYFTLATEKVMFELNKKVFAQEGNISTTTYKKMKEIKKQLDSKEYYKETPELQELSDYLKTADASEKITAILNNLSLFSTTETRERITINRITAFTNQFPDHLHEACLAFLQHLKVYSDKLLEEEIYKLLDKIDHEGQKIGIAYLGKPGDSGTHISYYIRDSFGKYQLEPKQLDDELISSCDQIIIFDDNINSGLQVLNIMAELLGELEHLPPEKNLHESHTSALQRKESKNKLKSMELHFCYIVGFEDAENNVKELLNQYLKFEKNKIHVHLNNIIKRSEKIFNGEDSKFNHENKLELREFITSIGIQLMKNEGKTPGKAEHCKLGYVNAEAMVLFPYNVPTMTITALWCRGMLDNNIPWIPLIERRRRKDKNGNYLGEE
ncbi:MAG: HD domain-containing protein [Treponema sp.]|nr:HD domain-containing protein [Treponema sp.]